MDSGVAMWPRRARFGRGKGCDHFFSRAGKSHCPTYVSYSFRASSVIGAVARGPFCRGLKVKVPSLAEGSGVSLRELLHIRFAKFVNLLEGVILQLAGVSLSRLRT